jgi:hypothetical protein
MLSLVQHAGVLPRSRIDRRQEWTLGRARLGSRRPSRRTAPDSAPPSLATRRAAAPPTMRPHHARGSSNRATGAASASCYARAPSSPGSHRQSSRRTPVCRDPGAPCAPRTPGAPRQTRLRSVCRPSSHGYRSADHREPQRSTLCPRPDVRWRCPGRHAKTHPCRAGRSARWPAPAQPA